jgi:hypothetical protein
MRGAASARRLLLSLRAWEQQGQVRRAAAHEAGGWRSARQPIAAP